MGLINQLYTLRVTIMIQNRFTKKVKLSSVNYRCKGQNYSVQDLVKSYEPRHKKNQQSAYAKTKMQISFAVTVKLISAFVFATWIVQYLFFLNTKFQASRRLQYLYSLVCVRPGQKPHCWFSHVAALMSLFMKWFSVSVVLNQSQHTVKPVLSGYPK